MYLKSVEIQGFKTFARKTELVFEPGITAIVGPNGSGKSNLVDAIRWVLGERSARELRGSRMEEIVYSGGTRRPASSMAEVRLVIDNSDGRLPVPYAEVEVLRRGYRSGESDFWLNGTRCRMKDIEQLFASTGLTQQGYAVVAQDDIDFIIQTSANERRLMIEEAAGVRGLRSRRQEAISKLKEADLSIVRLKDLVHELGPRVEELRRQAEQASRQRELTVQLDALRGSLLRGEWLAARQRAARAGARVETLGAQVAAARAEAETHAAAYAVERQRVAAAHEAQLAFERRVGELRLRANQARSRHELLVERARAAVRAVEEMEAALDAARQRLAPLEEECVAAKSEAAAADELQLAPADDEAIAAHSAAAAAALVAEAEAEAARLELRELERRAASLQARADQLKERDATLAASVSEAEAAAAEADAELAGLSLTAADDPGLEQAFGRAESVLAEARTAHDEAVAAEVSARRRAQERADEALRLEERVAALGLLGAGDEPPQAGARRVAEVLDVPENLRPAVEAALGREVLDSWVAETPAGQTELVLGMERDGADGSVLLAHGAPASGARVGPVEGATALRDQLNPPAWLAPALDVLLADTWLVGDLVAGRKLCGARPGATAVTLRGQAVAGITLRSHPGARTLDVRQRLRRALADLETASRDADRAREQALSAGVALEATTHELEAARAAWEEARSARATLAAQRASEAGRLEQVRSRAERVRVQLVARRDARAAAEVELATVAAECTAVATQLETAAARASAAELRATEARGAADSLRWNAEAARAQRAAMHTRRQGAQARMERSEALLARHREEVSAAEVRLVGARDLVSAAQDELHAAEAAAVAAESELASLPVEGEGVQLEALTQRIVEMERENLDRQVAVAHQEEVLQGARAQFEMEAATLYDLAERMGGEAAAELQDGEVDWEKTQRDIARLERQILQLGLVNPLAVEEFERDSGRLEGIGGQLDDLAGARADLEKISLELSGEIDRRFEAVFGAVAFNFQETFSTLFEGGKATLKLDDPAADEPGVDILAQPAGKRMRGIKLLSGGERALTALAFILALERVNPSPFYIFDEVDAPLDDANVRRFSAMLRSLSEGHQYLLVTHNHITMTAARALYGVTLEDSGVSRVVSVRLSDEATPVPVGASAAS